MNLNALIAAIGAHNWLVLVMIGALYARTLFSEKSRFPWSWAPNWLPLLSGLAGAVITVDAAMQGGATFGGALPMGLLGLVAAGFFDGLLAAIFGSPANAPTWAKFLVGIIDDIKGPPGGSRLDPVTSAANAPPRPPGLTRLALLAAVAALSCNQPPAKTVSEVDTGVAASLCVFDVAAADASDGKNTEQTVADALVRCSKYALTEAQVSGLLGAHRKAERAEGFVVKP